MIRILVLLTSFSIAISSQASLIDVGADLPQNKPAELIQLSPEVAEADVPKEAQVALLGILQESSCSESVICKNGLRLSCWVSGYGATCDASSDSIKCVAYDAPNYFSKSEKHHLRCN